MWRIAASTVSRSSTGSSSSRSHRRPLTPNRSEHGGLPFRRRMQHRVDLVLRARPRAHQLLTAREPAAHHPAALVGHPHRVQLPRPQQPRQRARVEPVGLRARLRIPVSSGLTTTTRSHVRLEDPRDLPRSRPSPPTPPDPARTRLSREQLKPSGVSRHPRPPTAPRPSSQIATSQKSRCTSNPIALPTHLLTPSPPSRRRTAGEPAGQRQRPIRARSTIQASRRGGRTKSPGSKPIVANRPTRLRSPNKAPVPDHPTLRPDPDRAFRAVFMPESHPGSRPLEPVPDARAPALIQARAGPVMASPGANGEGTNQRVDARPIGSPGRGASYSLSTRGGLSKR